MRIETTSGHVILADDADYHLIRDFSWFANKTPGGRFYAYATSPKTGGKRVAMHRLLMQPPTHMVVHHKNDNGLDNRRENLEITTNRQNIIYARVDRPCVFRHRNKWRAQVIGPDGRRVSLGVYTIREDALAASAKFKQETRA